MDVDGLAVTVLDVDDVHPVPAGPVDDRQGLRMTVVHGGQAQPALLVGEARDHRDQLQPGLAPQRVGEHLGHLRRPQVLVLDVDQAPGPAQGLGVPSGRAALTVGGERVAGAAAGVGPQQLHRAGAGGRRVRLRLRQVRGAPVEAAQHVRQHVPGHPGQRGRVLPAFSEHVLHVTHGRPAQPDLDVVPGGAATVAGGERLGLGVAAVHGVVAPAVAQVDPTDERDVGGRVLGVADDDELLVVAAHRPDPLVEQDLALVVVDVLRQVAVLLRRELEPVEVGAPEQALDHRPAPGHFAERPAHGRPVVGQQLVGVTTPVREDDEVTGSCALQRLQQHREVGAPVDQWQDLVALGPGLQSGGVVPALGSAEEPVADVARGRCRFGLGHRRTIADGEPCCRAGR